MPIEIIRLFYADLTKKISIYNSIDSMSLFTRFLLQDLSHISYMVS